MKYLGFILTLALVGCQAPQPAANHFVEANKMVAPPMPAARSLASTSARTSVVAPAPVLTNHIVLAWKSRDVATGALVTNAPMRVLWTENFSQPWVEVPGYATNSLRGYSTNRACFFKIKAAP